MIRILSALALCGVLATPVYAASAAVSAACRDDAIKFCRDVIRNETKRQACMKQHAAQLSKKCIDAIKADKAANGSGGSGDASGGSGQ